MSPARILILVVAYEAESTLAAVLARIPDSLLQHDTEVLVIDDASQDTTFETAIRSSEANRHRVRVLCNRENQSYGGNQKIGYEYAIRFGFDVVILLHGDGQYAPEVIPALIAPILDEEADAVLGSRMLVAGAARRGRMPLYKLIGNRVLTAVQNRLLGSSLSEFHSGLRAYRVDALRRVPFQFNTNDFHFDTEIIIQFMLGGHRIRQVPIPTHYGDEVCRVNGIRYATAVLLTTCLSRMQKLHVLYDRRYDVTGANAVDELKIGYRSSDTMALDAVRAGSRVLAIGCGPGFIAAQLAAKGCQVTGVDQRPPAVPHAFTEFLAWKEPDPFPQVDLSRYDVVLMLDVIEHLKQPECLLDRLRQSARDVHRLPRFIITSGNVAFAIIRVQMLLGNLNYGKRGILDLTHTRLYTFASLRRLLEQCGYRVTRVAGVPAPFPKALGDAALSRALLRANEILITLARRLFAYQIFLVAVPSPSLEALLNDSIETGRTRAEMLSRGNRRPTGVSCLSPPR